MTERQRPWRGMSDEELQEKVLDVMRELVRRVKARGPEPTCLSYGDDVAPWVEKRSDKRRPR